MNRLSLILIAVALITLFLFVSNMDYQDQQAMAVAKPVPMDREAAHRKAVRLREQTLLDDANNLGYPVAHLPPEEK